MAVNKFKIIVKYIILIKKAIIFAETFGNNSGNSNFDN